jgi:hydrogenase maturation protease
LLVEQIEGRAQVSVLDAMRGGWPAGTLRLLDPDELADEPGGLSSHGWGVAESLALARALGTLPERLDLIGIEMGEGDEDLAGRPLPEGIMRGLCPLLARLLASRDAV